ncbi:MAG: Fe-S cluster assembly protein SufD [Bacteroidota bacterium]
MEDIFINNFKTFESQLNGGAKGHVHDIRKKAISSFESLGIPKAKNEEYKYTNLGKALEKNFDFSTPSAEGNLNQEIIANHVIPNMDANVLVFINGIYSANDSKIISPADEIEIKTLKEAFSENTEEVEKHFARYSDYQKDAYVALNTSFSREGMFINIPKNKIVEKPVALYFINDATEAQTYNQPRNLFVAGENSQVTFVEVFKTEGSEGSFCNAVTEIVVNRSAYVNYYKVQNDVDNAYHVGATDVWQDHQSNFSAYTITLSGAIVRNNLNVIQDGEGCETHMYGLYLVNEKTHVDNHTAVDHKQPNSFSNELYKGVLEGRSRGVFNGKVYVRQAAQKTNAFQSNKNILLSDTAKVNTKPQLEIWADDVKCSHGCTTGQLDEDALFYLQARGLSKTSARALLLYAFAMEVIENLKLEPVKNYLEHIISDRLHKDF